MFPKRIARFSGPYRYLSNFWPAVVTLDGVEYPTVEHAYQAAKTVDPELRKRIRDARTPGQAKRAGRGVTLRHDWETAKFSVMEDLLRQKFADGELKDLLLGTGDLELIEGNSWGDTIWGVDEKKGGQNHLGRLLMKIRADLRSSAG